MKTTLLFTNDIALIILPQVRRCSKAYLMGIYFLYYEKEDTQQNCLTEKMRSLTSTQAALRAI